MPSDVLAQGWDISLNHGAIVQLRNGELDNFWYYTDVASSADRSHVGSRLVINKKLDKQAKAMERLAWIENWIITTLGSSIPHYVGIEDYAFGAEQGAHQLGEAGGVARMALWRQGLKWRLHDPISVKMFATYDSTAQKDAVEAAVAERWNLTFGDYNAPPPKKGKQSRRTSEDLADAFAIAQLVWTEVQLRCGQIRMDELHPKEIQVFNRVTKTYPESLLSRDWIQNPSVQAL